MPGEFQRALGSYRLRTPSRHGPGRRQSSRLRRTLSLTTGSRAGVGHRVPASGSAAVDTIGAIETLGARYGVSLSFGAELIQSTTRAASPVGGVTVMVLFTATDGGKTDSAMINRLGKVVR